ncbi:Type I secretion system ATP-binding protein PrsD [Alphaproteobacteria bacterium SO-S41]|nr:Type I secretion system ATP-binding protein PrsD [Alphaproteobacteria bacterium SO-S41]
MENRSGPSRQIFTDLLRAFRGALATAAFLSVALNILTLSGAIFMLQIYDRIIPSGSVQSLFVLLALVLMLYVFMAWFDVLRGRLFSRLAQAADARFFPAVFDTLFSNRPRGERAQSIRDVDAVRNLVSSTAPATLFDLPWALIFLVLLFMLHVSYGIETLIGLAAIISLTLIADRRTRGPVAQATRALGDRQRIASEITAQTDTIVALGMKPGLLASLTASHGRAVDAAIAGQDPSDTISAISKAVRLFFQSAILATGAWLVINGAATAGVIVAASIISARALAPIEQSIAHWRNFTAARQAWTRLVPLLTQKTAARHALPAPSKKLEVQGLILIPPGGTQPVIRGVGFALRAGEALGVIGPSGSGKTSLARALVGCWPAAQGEIRLDGATLDQWGDDAIGPWMGYLPHGGDLLSGTIAENISRFSVHRDDAQVFVAAQKAGVVDTILRLPQGFDTVLGEGGIALSAGQAQRVALARAVYGDPFLVVLDEPNANFDAESDIALAETIRSLKARKAIVIIMAHRPSAITEVDHLLYLQDGKQIAFGPKDEVLRRYTAPSPSLRSVSTGEAR